MDWGRKTNKKFRHAKFEHWSTSPFYEISERSTGVRILYLSPGSDEYYMVEAGGNKKRKKNIEMFGPSWSRLWIFFPYPIVEGTGERLPVIKHRLIPSDQKKQGLDYLPWFEFLQEITNHLPFKIGVREVKLRPIPRIEKFCSMLLS